MHIHVIPLHVCIHTCTGTYHGMSPTCPTGGGRGYPWYGDTPRGVYPDTSPSGYSIPGYTQDPDPRIPGIPGSEDPK